MQILRVVAMVAVLSSCGNRVDEALRQTADLQRRLGRVETEIAGLRSILYTAGLTDADGNPVRRPVQPDVGSGSATRE